MLRLTLATLAALSLPSVVHAQTAPNDPQSPPESFNQTAPPPTTAPAESVPMSPSSLPAQSTSAQPMPSMISPLPSTVDINVQPNVVVDASRIVEGDWTRYDTDGLSGLSQTEFSTWTAQLFANARTAPSTPDYYTVAFTQADVSKDSVIEKGELLAFLQGR